MHEPLPVEDTALADAVDRALVDVWAGSTGKLEMLLRECEDSQEPRSVFRDLLDVSVGAVPNFAPSSQFGPFVIQRELGRGGMGVVYEARQTRPNRTVALKIIRGRQGADRQLVRLFQREINALGRLSHSGIARIYDAGETSDSYHYFAMELVDGPRLTELANRPNTSLTRLDVRNRLELFCKVCKAVHHAHQNGVIHRDLKPSNILVDREGQPKVLDFGLAQLLDTDMSLAIGAGDMGQLIGTLAYMSPEQALGNFQVDVRSDVYSLGVILFELLIGKLPYDCKKSWAEVARVISETPPRRPSAVYSLLRGDIETIVLKALEKKPELRYQSALAMAEDIERFLTCRPILARPSSSAYQLKRLIARNPLSAILSLVFGSGITILATFSTYQAIQLAVERDAAISAQADEARARATAESVTRFFQNILAAADPANTGKDVRVRAALNVALEHAETELQNEPLVLAGVLDTVGVTLLQLGDIQRARVPLERALELRTKHLGTQNLVTVESQSHFAEVLLQLNHIDEAIKLFRQVLATRELMTPDNSPEIGVAANDLGAVLMKLRQFDEAAPLLQRSIEILEKSGQLSYLAAALNHYGMLLVNQGQPELSIPVLSRSVELRIESYGENHSAVATGLGNLAVAMEKTGEFERALELQVRALKIRRESLGNTHPRIASTLNNLANVYIKLGQSDLAEGCFAESVAVRKRIYDSPNLGMIRTQRSLGCLQIDRGRLAEADINLHQALEMAREVLRDGHSEVARIQTQLARLGIRKGQYDTAQKQLEELIRRSSAPSQRIVNAKARQTLASLHVRNGQPDRAAALARAALQTLESVEISDEYDIITCRTMLASCLHDAGNLEEAYHQGNQAYSHAMAYLGPRHHLSINVASVWGVILMCVGDLNNSESVLRDAISRAEQVEDVPLDVTRMEISLAKCLCIRQNYIEAESLLYRIIARLSTERLRAEELKETIQTIRTLYQSWHRPIEAAIFYLVESELSSIGRSEEIG